MLQNCSLNETNLRDAIYRRAVCDLRVSWNDWRRGGVPLKQTEPVMKACKLRIANRQFSLHTFFMFVHRVSVASGFVFV